jgi:hypothetical protein
VTPKSALLTQRTKAIAIGRTATYEAVMDIVKNHLAAYGVGVEYAYTIVHGATEQRWMNP